MSDLNKLLEVSKEYLDAHNKRNARFKAWTGGVADSVKETLGKIVTYLQENNDFFKSNLYADEYYPSIEDGGVELLCVPMRGVYIKSGNNLVTSYSDQAGRKSKRLSENGFQIHFIPFFNGKIHVYVTQHTTNQNREADYKTLEIIDDPNSLTEEKITDLVYEGFKYASMSSFLFQGDKK